MTKPKDIIWEIEVTTILERRLQETLKDGFAGIEGRGGHV